MDRQRKGANSPTIVPLDCSEPQRGGRIRHHIHTSLRVGTSVGVNQASLITLKKKQTTRKERKEKDIHDL